MQLESNLRAILTQRGVKQSWLAARVGVRQGTISDLVNNKTVPSLLLALAIADVLEVKVEEIWKILR
ncbi:hypothetical protein BC6307_19415 [Sutcliffiella cohnii]|uniref:HTH cro/C1-type domain-containing protein n=1 Tax=Sutcliffiella cohnii TaxID=33932 RepID=A0A223KUU8_9BACI|nr:helix-turn-helix transcriptional regulator [Sutcliffiella cohnii]AST93272.1 hypothetical protein BC6307_19415 [Sutcliffiella cohnii]